MQKKKSTKKYLALIVMVTVISTTFFMTVARAASLTGLSDTMSNQTVSAHSSHIIKYTAVTPLSAPSQTIVVTFPSGFNFTSKTISTVSLTHGPSTGTEYTEALAASPGSATWGAVFSGTNNVILTLTTPTSGSGAAPIASNDKVIITYTSVNSVNPTGAANYSISLGSNGDTGVIMVPIITNSQVSVSATVNQILSFSMSSGLVGFGTLSSSNTQFATGNGTGSSTEPTFAHTMNATTNVSSGYSITISGSTLTSGPNSIAAIPGSTPQSLVVGTPQFGIRATVASGTGAVEAPFNGGAGQYGFGTAPLLNQLFATSLGTTAATIYNINYAANISGATPTGSYITSLTYVVTANF